VGLFRCYSMVPVFSTSYEVLRRTVKPNAVNSTLKHTKIYHEIFDIAIYLRIWFIYATMTDMFIWIDKGLINVVRTWGYAQPSCTHVHKLRRKIATKLSRHLKTSKTTDYLCLTSVIIHFKSRWNSLLFKIKFQNFKFYLCKTGLK
jgi:hypothetical protein